jgi:type I restriction enzyme M protein
MRADGLAMGWVWTRDRPQKRMVNRANPAVLFIDRALQLLRAGGSLAVIVPNSLLSGRKYLYFRDYLMGRIEPEAGICGAGVTINASISLPPHTFAPSGTTAKTSVLCLTKTTAPEAEDYNILMAVVDHVGYLYRRKQVIPDPKGNELIEVVEEYHKHKKGIE